MVADVVEDITAGGEEHPSGQDGGVPAVQGTRAAGKPYGCGDAQPNPQETDWAGEPHERHPARQEDATRAQHGSGRSGRRRAVHGSTTWVDVVEPSEKVVASDSLLPDRNSWPWRSEAKITKLPPSATTKFTAAFPGSLRSGPSSVWLAPTTKYVLLISVSQLPTGVLLPAG